MQIVGPDYDVRFMTPEELAQYVMDETGIQFERPDTKADFQVALTSRLHRAEPMVVVDKDTRDEWMEGEGNGSL